ncbi:MAG: signal peptidase II [Candidatus Omnitrophica bacterium]|nr:signal peptidase II [Candidatus Omnitrophota bacterium]MCM8806830.1 signal peptidase II [Candidatus Omnitrophota bacterium]
MKNKINLFIFITTTLLSCFLDQITKNFFMKILEENGNIEIFKFLSFTLVKNYGIFFGLFNNDKIKVFMIAFSVLAVFLIPIYFLKTEKKEKIFQFSLGLIEGGILGNLIDRIKNGYVIDFINFHFWPVFNFADSFIVIGVIIFFLNQLRG